MARALDPTLLALSPEEFEARVHRVLIPKFRRDISDIKIRRRARRLDSHGIRHEFDLWYQYRVGVVEHHVAVEVRRTSRPISLDDMRAFFGKVVDMPQRPAALMVSLAGFQSGARTFATKKGIGMYVLRKDMRGRTVIHENPITPWRGRGNTVRFAASLAVVLADAIAELQAAAQHVERPWSWRSSPPRFPMYEVKFVDGEVVFRELPTVWIPPARAGGNGRIEPVAADQQAGDIAAAGVRGELSRTRGHGSLSVNVAPRSPRLSSQPRRGRG